MHERQFMIVYTDLQPHLTNPKSWLPPCYLSVEVAGSAIQGHTLNRQNNRKAPATPHTTRPGGIRSGRAPGQSEARRWQETVRIEEGELHFNGYTNPQGWLPPATISVVVAGSAIHGHTLNRQINRKAPATLHTSRPGGADQNGHPDRVKARGAAGKPKKKWRAGFTRLPFQSGLVWTATQKVDR